MSDTSESTSESWNEHGWLGKQPDAEPEYAGIRFDDSPTRTEEFGYVVRKVQGYQPGVALDAGCGFSLQIHALPHILANMGWWVEAVDLDLRQFTLPFHSKIRRTHANIGAMPYRDTQFDLITCISVLEHMSPENITLFFVEAYRLLKKQGRLIITMDKEDPETLASWFVQENLPFDVGELQPEPSEHLNPKVSYLAATKP